jgi:hypothetical protein
MPQQKSGMVRPKLDDYWIGWLATQFANEPAPNIREIARRVDEQAKKTGRTDQPAQSTIYKYYDVYKEWPEHVKAGYKIFHWPASMEEGLLDWAAGPASLELLTFTQRYDLSNPPIPVVFWFWRLTEVLPQAPLGERLRLAITIASHKEAGLALPEDLELWLTNPDLRKDVRAQVKPTLGGASAAWAVEFVFNPEARFALKEGANLNEDEKELCN